MDCSPPGSSVHGISQARMLEWVAISFSRGVCPTQRSNPGLLHCRQILYWLSHQGSLGLDKLASAWRDPRLCSMSPEVALTSAFQMPIAKVGRSHHKNLADPTFTPTLQVEKLRSREVKQLVQVNWWLVSCLWLCMKWQQRIRGVLLHTSPKKEAGWRRQEGCDKMLSLSQQRQSPFVRPSNQDRQ